MLVTVVVIKYFLFRLGLCEMKKILNKYFVKVNLVKIVFLISTVSFSTIVYSKLQSPDTEVDSASKDLNKIYGDAGEVIDAPMRTLSFRNVDINIKGNSNSLPITVSRVYDINRSQPALRVPFSLGNWDLEVPRITSWRGLHRSDGTTFQYEDDVNIWSNGYCDNPVYTQGTGDIEVDLFYWLGLALDIPGDDTRELLFSKQNVNGVEKIVYPYVNVISGEKGAVTYMSTDNWKAECIDLPQGSRSGFRVTSPEGVQYRFDMFASPKSKVNPDKGWWHTLGAYVYVSEIRDVHGNTLNYSYESDQNGNLHVSEIRASDGRIVKFEYQEVDLTGHVFWQPAHPVKLLRYVRHYSDDEQAILKEVEYNYTFIERSQPVKYNLGKLNSRPEMVVEHPYQYGDRWTLATVKRPDGRYWEYGYTDFDWLVNYSIWSSQTPGDECDDDWTPFGWGCGPTYSTLPAKLTWLSSPETGVHRYVYREGFGYGQNQREEPWTINPNRTWKIEQIWEDLDGDGEEDVTTFVGQRESVANGNDIYVTTVDYPWGKRERYGFWIHDIAGDWDDLSRFETLKGGLPTFYEIYEVDGQNEILLKSTNYEWAIGELVGDNASICWIEECDKPELYRKHMTGLTTALNGHVFTTLFSDFDDFGNPKTTHEFGTKNRVIHNTYFNEENSWIIGVIEDETIENVGTIDRTFNSDGKLIYESLYGVVKEYDYYQDGTLRRQFWQKDEGAGDIEIIFSDYHRGLPQREEHPEQIVIERKVDDVGNIEWQRDGRGHKTSYSYDALDRRTFMSPENYQATITDWYNISPNYIIEQFGDYQKRSKVDHKHRPIEISEDDVTTVGRYIYRELVYDKGGRLEHESYPVESNEPANPYGWQFPLDGVNKTYDALNRPLVIEETATGHVVTYCYGTACNASRLGKPEVQFGYVKTDADGYETIYNFDVFGDTNKSYIKEIIQQVRQSPDIYITTTMSRNLLGQIDQASQGNYTRQYTYNSKNQLWKVDDPERGLSELTYDLVGNMKTRRIGNNPAIEYHYDGINRVRSIHYHDVNSRDVTLDYDENGNQTLFDNGVVRQTYSYNDLNKVERLTALIGEQTFVTQYSYNYKGDLSGMTYPSGNVIFYWPDAFGRPTELYSSAVGKELVESIDYDVYHRIRLMELGDGNRYEMTRNNRQLPDIFKVTDSGQNALLSLAHSYDARKNIIGIDDQVDNSGDKTLGYDGLLRLVAAESSWGNGNISYDDTGNITSMLMGGVNKVYDYDVSSNRLISVSGVGQLNYDDYGNVSSLGTDQYIYGASGNLKNIQQGSSNISYEYGNNSLRALQDKDDFKRYYIYGNGDDVLYSFEPGFHGNSSEYLYLDKRLVARLDCDNSDLDWDGDGIPGCFERRWGLSDANSLDGTQDNDQDGVTNVAEYLQSTDILSLVDEDNDGMSDHWEVFHNLNPSLTADASEDADGDGLTNLYEYQNGFDPTKKAGASDYSYAWTQQLGNSAFDHVSSVAIDEYEDIYIVGKFYHNSELVYVAGLTSEGAIAWTQNQGVGTYPIDVETDLDGGVYVTGDNVFVSKLRPSDGYVMDTFEINGVTVNDLSVRGNAIYVVGTYSGVANFSRTGTDIHDGSLGRGFVAKLDQELNFLWTRSIGNNESVYDGLVPKGVATDIDGDVYLSGFFKETANFNPYSAGSGQQFTANAERNLFVTKWSSNGDYLWTTVRGKEANENWFSGPEGKYIYINKAGNPVVGDNIRLTEYSINGAELGEFMIAGADTTEVAEGFSEIKVTSGVFSNVVDFDPLGTGDPQISGSSGVDSDRYLRFEDKYGYSHTYVWNIENQSVNITDMAIDGLGSLYVVGNYYGETDFDPTSATDIFNPVGSRDIFISKYVNEGYASLVDSDADGILDVTDLDDDGDNIPDDWEIQYGMDPLFNDAGIDVDGDGLSALMEYSIGTRPDDSDTDNDGLSDGVEVDIGSNPRVNIAVMITIVTRVLLN